MAERGLTANTLAELTKSSIKPVTFVAVEFASSTVRYWTGLQDVVWNTFTWTAAGVLLLTAGAVEDAQLAAEGVTIELSGLDTAVVAAVLNNGRQSRVVEVYQGFLDASDTIIVDPYLLFGGLTDTFHITVGPDEAIVRVQAESRLIALRNTKIRRFTRQDQQNEFPGDLGLDYVTIVNEFTGQWSKDREGIGFGSTTPIDPAPKRPVIHY